MKYSGRKYSWSETTRNLSKFIINNNGIYDYKVVMKFRNSIYCDNISFWRSVIIQKRLAKRFKRLNKNYINEFTKR